MPGTPFGAWRKCLCDGRNSGPGHRTTVSDPGHSRDPHSNLTSQVRLACSCGLVTLRCDEERFLEHFWHSYNDCATNHTSGPITAVWSVQTARPPTHLPDGQNVSLQEPEWIPQQGRVNAYYGGFLLRRFCCQMQPFSCRVGDSFVRASAPAYAARAAPVSMDLFQVPAEPPPLPPGGPGRQ